MIKDLKPLLTVPLNYTSYLKSKVYDSWGELGLFYTSNSVASNAKLNNSGENTKKNHKRVVSLYVINEVCHLKIAFDATKIRRIKQA